MGLGTERSQTELGGADISCDPVTQEAWHDKKLLLLGLALEICIS